MVERKTPVESERRAVECLVHDFLEVMEARDSSRTAMFDQLVGLVCDQRAAAIEAAKQSGDFAAAVIQEAEPESDKCRHKSLTLFPFGVECHDCGAEMDE